MFKIFFKKKSIIGAVGALKIFHRQNRKRTTEISIFKGFSVSTEYPYYETYREISLGRVKSKSIF